jgi:hypothetical protein
MRLPPSSGRFANHLLLRLVTVAFVVGLAAGAEAQGSGAATREAESPLVWNPSLALTGIGYDSNVFNEVEDPKGDVVTTIAAGIRPIWQPGTARLSGDFNLAYNHFQKFDSERGVDGRVFGRAEFPIHRVRLFGSGAYVNLRDRLNFEVDERARRVDREVAAGIDVALTGVSTLGFSAIDRAFDIDEATPDLARALNRDERFVVTSLSHELTPLTTAIVSVEYGRHRFDAAPSRDGSTTQVSAGTRFGPGALFEGRWEVGWKRTTVQDPLVPAFSGVTADADLYVVLGSATRIGVRGRRDVSFSADSATPYYTENSIGGSITYGFADRWDVDVQALQVLLDDTVATATPVPVNTDERVTVVEAGLGYRLWARTRLGIYVERSRRRSDVPGRGYETTRIYTALSQPLGLP